MKYYHVILILAVFVGTGLISNPVFVVAKETCYVDKSADDDGDGSEDKPYQKISKALDKDCVTINVAKGTYGDDITLTSSVRVTGDSRDDVTISGTVTMKDGSRIEKVTIKELGIKVAEDADATVTNVIITEANIGISTVAGGGKLIVSDTKFYGNNKALYLQSGKEVDITKCDIYDNDEEGIDIRSNVEGDISDNTISDNGESGIEVILGKADLTITGNKIKNNKASGIAAQYYQGSGKSGAAKVKNNTITGNNDFGMNCKIPSGGNPGKEFWADALNMKSNKVSGNKDGDFSPECSFSEEVVVDASTTQKQKEQAAEKARLVLEQKAEAEQKRILEQKEKDFAQNRKTEDIVEKQTVAEQERLREQLQKETNIQNDITMHMTDLEKIYTENALSKKKSEGRNAFVMFFVGPNRKEVDKIRGDLVVYAQKIVDTQKRVDEITDEAIKNDAQMKVTDMKSKFEEMKQFVEIQNKEFSLFGWMFNKKS